LTGFLKGDFRQEKGHQLLNFGESQLMARKEASQGKNPLKPLFIFYRICDLPNSYHTLCQINGHKICPVLWCFPKLNRSFGEDFGSNLCNCLSCLPYVVLFVYDLSEKITKKEGEQIVIYQIPIILCAKLTVIRFALFYGVFPN